MTAVVKVKPKPSPVSKALSADSPNVIKEEVSLLSSDTVGLKLEPFPDIDIVKSWINTAMKGNVQKLELHYLEEFNGEIPLQLPWTMGCESEEVLNISAPSLKRLVVTYLGDGDQFIVNTPELEYLDCTYYWAKDLSLENLPSLLEARINTGMLEVNNRIALALVCIWHELEAIEHVFFSCGWTRPLWSSSNLSYKVNHVDSGCLLCFILDCGQKSP
ncbi:hypothetical protein RHGRI_015859 [Rhododendron griersonianum]|uniref:Reverse transcriptase zinc-binding domain-containing protein n=1 Tax=Rhododendron griersonianum TaxID=479676 RepID=A0AAV6JRU2_9ERIC|nr:hypothetical protein RHGRI_015859 [Rhododendron griersonianum]